MLLLMVITVNSKVQCKGVQCKVQCVAKFSVVMML